MNIVNNITIIDKAIEILKKYSLCDRCLGRLFGYLGKGMSNLERGKALKTIVLLEINRRIQEGIIDNDIAKTIMLNMQIDNMIEYLEIDKELEMRSCYICGNMLDKWIEEFPHIIVPKLLELHISSFVIGVSLAQDYVSREEQLAREFGLRYWESVKRELKREIGKRVASISSLKPVFDNPDVVVVINPLNRDISIYYPSLILYGYYWKYGRGISKNVKINKSGQRKYSLAIEDAIRYACNTINAAGYKFYTIGRNSADVRIIGGGEPIAIESKVLDKRIDIDLVEKALNSFTPWIKFSIRMRINRSFISRLLNSSTTLRKIYRAIMYTSMPITDKNIINKLESIFHNKIIEQKPKISIRKKSLKKKIYNIKIIPITQQLFEVLIECDEGLSITELISGSKGETSLSFTNILGYSVKCLMLDILYVHEYI